MKKIMSSCIIMLFMAMPLLSAEKMTIAIMDFTAKDINTLEASKISELIRSEMINSGQYIVLERTQVDKILKEQGFQMTGCTDVTCAVQVGKMLSARKILVGTVMRFGGNIAITGRVVDVEKGIAEFAEKERALSKDDEFYMIERFCDKLTMRITGKPIYQKEGVTDNNYQYSYMKKVYTPIKDPAAWTTLGFGLGSAALFAGSALNYHNKYHDINKYNIKLSMNKWEAFFSILILNGKSTSSITTIIGLNIWVWQWGARDKFNEEKDTRKYIYIAGGAVGGAALISLFTFIGRYVYNTKVANLFDSRNKVALFFPTQYFEETDLIKPNKFGFGLGFSFRL